MTAAAWLGCYYGVLGLALAGWAARRVVRAAAARWDALVRATVGARAGSGVSLTIDTHEVAEALRGARPAGTPIAVHRSNHPVWLEESQQPLYGTVEFADFAAGEHRVLIGDDASLRARAPWVSHEQIHEPKLFVVSAIEALLTSPQDATALGASDRAALLHEGAVSLQIGERIYWTGPLAALPERFRAGLQLTIPARQLLVVKVHFDRAVPLTHRWRLTILLRGSLGREL